MNNTPTFGHIFKNQLYFARNIDLRLMTFMVCNFCFHVGFSVIFSIYPPLANKQVGLDYTHIGWVFAANPIGAVFMSIFAGQQISGWGRKRCLIISQIAQIISLLILSQLPLLQDSADVFFLVSLFSRLMQGITGSVYLTTSFSYVPIFWKDTIEQKLGYIETITAISVLFGPFMGALFDQYFGFQGPFILLATCMTCGIFVTIYCIPNDEDLQTFGIINKHASLSRAFSSPKILATLLAIITVITSCSYYSTFYVAHMSSFGIEQLVASIFQTVNTLGCNIIGLQVVTRLPASFDRAFTISLGVIFSGIGTLLMAPFWTDRPHSAVSLILGQLMVGAIQGFSFIPSIPQMTILLSNIYNDPDLLTKLSDLSSSLFVFGMYMGLFLSNIVGGKIYDIYGGSNINSVDTEKQAFHSTSMTIAGLVFFALILFLIYGDGMVGWRRTISSSRQTPQNVQKLCIQNQIVYKWRCKISTQNQIDYTNTNIFDI